ncbi:MAG: hypothetical protein ACRCYY_19305 [Trueperaceae bacterium]
MSALVASMPLVGLSAKSKSITPELRINDGLWTTFSALLDGPATARALSDRLQRPLAVIVRDLGQLNDKGLILEDGTERIGGFIERRYRLPDTPIEFHDRFALPTTLRQVESGFNKAIRFDLLHEAGLVAVRVSQDVAKDISEKALALREELEAQNQAGQEGVRFNLFTAAYTEESEKIS